MLDDTSGDLNDELIEEAVEEVTEESPEETNIHEENDLSKEEEKLHLQALNIIGSVLDEDYKGDRKKFFESNPDLAEKANRSKKYKEIYRALEKDSEAPKPIKPSKKEVSEQDIVDKAAMKVYQMGLDTERDLQIKKFAETEGINVDHIDSLKASAKALFEANKGNIPFNKCLIAAQSAFETTEKSSQKLPSSQPINPARSKKEYTGEVGQWVSAV